VILEKLVPNFQTYIKSEIPASYFHLYLNGDFSPIPSSVDVGCIQEDFIGIDSEKTFQRLEEFFSRSEKLIEQETQWLKQNKVDLILSDASSLPLKAAHRAGIPSVLISNFTWHDIYSHFPGAEKRQGILDALKEEYALASLQILPQCHIVNDMVQNKKEVGFISRKGKDVTCQLEAVLGISCRDKTIIFIYLGDMGAQSVQWENLEKLEDMVFITRDPLPKNVANLFVLDDRFLYQDLIASSDIVCTKAGYSTLATAFTHEKPVISCSRENFREYQAMRDYINDKQIGLIMDSTRFYSCDWEEDIRKALTFSVKGKVPLNGEEEIMRTINCILQG
jgi:UDP-N-acetylglucosamine transferase subunit ALG13